MERSGYVSRIPKAAESLADNPMSITHGMELLKTAIASQSEKRTDRRKKGTSVNQREWPSMDKNEELLKRGEKVQGVPKTLWREGTGMRGEETFLQRNEENDHRLTDGITHPAEEDGRSKDLWIRGDHQTRRRRAHLLKGELSQRRGGERGPQNEEERDLPINDIEMAESVFGRRKKAR